MLPSLPIVSVIVPTRNRASLLAPALASILRQSLRSLECLVVNDGSTDDTRLVLDTLARQDQRVVPLHLEVHTGLQRALNTGLQRARGAFIARLDDDDAWTDEGKLEAQVARFLASPSLQLLGTGARIVDPSGRHAYIRQAPDDDAALRRALATWNPFVHSSVMFRREMALAAGGYDERLHHSEDYGLWLELGRRGHLGMLPTVAVEYRLADTPASLPTRLRSCAETLYLAARFGGQYGRRSRALAHGVARTLFHLLPLPHAARLVVRRLQRR